LENIEDPRVRAPLTKLENDPVNQAINQAFNEARYKYDHEEKLILQDAIDLIIQKALLRPEIQDASFASPFIIFTLRVHSARRINRRLRFSSLEILFCFSLPTKGNSKFSKEMAFENM